MCKKLLIAAIAIAVGVGVVSGTRLGSHIRLKWQKFERVVEESIPLETEIERLRMELKHLGKEDATNLKVVAEQKTVLDNRRGKLTTDKSALARMGSRIQELRTALSEGAEFVAYNGTRYKKSEVEQQINLDGPKFLADTEAVKADEETLQILEQTFEQNLTKLRNLEVTRKKMETRLAQLEKELTRQRALAEQNKFNVDDTGYSRINNDMNKVENRLKVMKNQETIGQSAKGPIQAAEDKKAEQDKLKQALDAQLGAVEVKKVVGDSK